MDSYALVLIMHMSCRQDPGSVLAFYRALENCRRDQQTLASSGRLPNGGYLSDYNPLTCKAETPEMYCLPIDRRVIPK